MGFRYFHGGIVSASTIPAGWYAEPGSIGRERYWNGSAWTSDARLVQQGDLSTGSAREETTVGATSRSKWRSRRLAIGVVVALLFVAISGFAIWTQVRLANTQTALNGKTAEAAQLRTDLLNTQQQLTDSRNQLASSQSQLADAQSQLTNTESQLSDARDANGLWRVCVLDILQGSKDALEGVTTLNLSLVEQANSELEAAKAPCSAASAASQDGGQGLDL